MTLLQDSYDRYLYESNFYFLPWKGLYLLSLEAIKKKKDKINETHIIKQWSLSDEKPLLWALRLPQAPALWFQAQQGGLGLRGLQQAEPTAESAKEESAPGETPRDCRGPPGTTRLRAMACGEASEGWGKKPGEVWEERREELTRGWGQDLRPPEKPGNSPLGDCGPERTGEPLLTSRPRLLSIYIFGTLVWIISYQGVFVLCIVESLTPSLTSAC